MYLGISAYFHDSSVALIDTKGKLIDFQKEEWHSRVKGDKSFPRLAIKRIFENSNISSKNIKSIVFYEKPFRSWLTIMKFSLKNNNILNSVNLHFFKNFWKSSISFYLDILDMFKFDKKKIFYSDHHLSHTLSALFYSKTNEPKLSIVIDGYGDCDCSSIHLVKNSKQIYKIWNSPYPQSLGLFYTAVTDFLGFQINEGEHKVMALAAYGKPLFYNELLKIVNFNNGNFFMDMDYFDFHKRLDRSFSEKFEKIFKIKSRTGAISLDLKDSNFKIYANIASSAQKLVEIILMQIFEYAYNKTKIKNFLFSGGVALNCVAVQKISKLKFINKLEIPPSPGDSGAAIGSAYLGFLQDNKEKKPSKKKLFPGMFIQNETFFNLVFQRISSSKNLFKNIAKLLEQNQILATCYENIETGPRSLGHRSLICNAYNQDLVNLLNSKIKKRSQFRPLAPCMTLKTAKQKFNINSKISNLYDTMSVVADYKKKNIKKKPFLHIDKTSRIQICEKNSFLEKIFSKTKKLDILINTSFNIAGDPVVYNFEDAYLSMKRMNLKYLVTKKGIYKIK